MSPALGIDLGTTNSLVAYVKDGQPQVIPNVEGDPLTPSVVAFTRDKKTWVGALAKAPATANPDNTIFSIKRHMGVSVQPAAAGKVVSSIKRHMGSDYLVKANGRIYTPPQISAMILSKLKADAEQFLAEPIEKAVITVPAYFNDTQRRATKDAGTIAGLDCIRIINEPTAAALAYGLDMENVHTVLVWDLGGGTFDVSILELGDGVFEVKAVCGDTWLGGDDYDERLAGLLAERLGWDACFNEDSAARRLLTEMAERAKVKLSTASSVTVAPSAAHSTSALSPRPSVTVSREEFEELTRDLTERMVPPTRQALSDARVDPIEIDRVILVGGATRMPAVGRLAEEITGLQPYRHVDPDKVVALGAAIQAGVLSGQVREVTLVDVNPLSLGIETQGGVFARVIERNTPIPASRSQLFTNAQDNQTSVNIHVLQGEREMAAYNTSLGHFELTDIEPQPRGEARIEVTFDIDANGIAHVSAHDLQTGSQKRIRVESADRLSQEDIQRMLADAQAHAQSDRREREEVLTAIRARNLIRAAGLLEEQARELPSRRPAQEELAAVGQTVCRGREALADGRHKPIQAASVKLEKALRHLDQALKASEQATRETTVAGRVREAGP